MAQEIDRSKESPAPPSQFADPFSAMRAEMNRMFDAFMVNGFPRIPLPSSATWRDLMVPSVDLRETDKEFVVEAELPGMDEKDISVTLSNGVLTIKGEKKSERDEKKDDYHLMERNYGSFRRSLSLGDTVNADKVEAKFEKGVLKVTLAKSAATTATEKKIPIGKG